MKKNKINIEKKQNNEFKKEFDKLKFNYWFFSKKIKAKNQIIITTRGAGKTQRLFYESLIEGSKTYTDATSIFLRWTNEEVKLFLDEQKDYYLSYDYPFKKLPPINNNLKVEKSTGSFYRTGKGGKRWKMVKCLSINKLSRQNSIPFKKINNIIIDEVQNPFAKFIKISDFNKLMQCLETILRGKQQFGKTYFFLNHNDDPTPIFKYFEIKPNIDFSKTFSSWKDKKKNLAIIWWNQKKIEDKLKKKKKANYISLAPSNFKKFLYGDERLNKPIIFNKITKNNKLIAKYNLIINNDAIATYIDQNNNYCFKLHFLKKYPNWINEANSSFKGKLINNKFKEQLIILFNKNKLYFENEYVAKIIYDII